MSYPTPGEYQAALQHPGMAFLDPNLQEAEPIRSVFGLPQPVTGAFALSFPVRTPMGRMAIRCFLSDRSLRSHHYAEVAIAIREASLPYFVEFEYQEHGIRIRDRSFPIIWMRWVEGETLNQFVERHLGDPQILGQLAEKWLEMLQDLAKYGLAHGDLQHGNIIVTPAADGDVALRLIDYDAMYVPKLNGRPSPELGHRNYQHPDRSRDDYDNTIDRFPGFSIYTALKVLEQRPDLWERANTGENLLFSADDYFSPDRSVVFAEARSVHTLASLVDSLVWSCTATPSGLPAVIDLVRSAKPSRAVDARTDAPAIAVADAMEFDRLSIGIHAAVILITLSLPMIVGLGPGLSASTILVGLILGYHWRRYRSDERFRRRKALPASHARYATVFTQIGRQLDQIDGAIDGLAARRAALINERLETVRNASKEAYLRLHLVSELEEIDGISHKTVIRLKAAGIRTAFHADSKRVNGIRTISDTQKEGVRLWRSELNHTIEADLPNEPPPSDVLAIDRRLKRRTADLNRDRGRLVARQSAQAREMNRISEMLEEHASYTKSLYLKRIFVRSANR